MMLLRTSIELLNIKNQWRCMQERDKKFMAEKDKSFILLSCRSLCPAESPISDISPRHSDLSATQEELQTGKTDPQEPPGLQRTSMAAGRGATCPPRSSEEEAMPGRLSVFVF
ncbi:uncharacterized protein ACNLHF_013622 isoform 1-T4 [Anomaloglossus baeobatrachus]